MLVNAGLGGEASPPSVRATELGSRDGTRWTVIDGNGPPVRSFAGVVYDEACDELVMDGGSYSLDLRYGDTRTWKPSRGWKRIVAAGGPGVRDHLQLAYDVRAVRSEGSG